MRTLIRGSFAALCVALLPLLSPVGVFGAETPDARAPQTRLVGVVNVNTATAEELELLPGVGPARSRAIIDFRKENGSFKQAGDLVQVSGIGEKAFERMRPHVRVSGKTTATLER